MRMHRRGRLVLFCALSSAIVVGACSGDDGVSSGGDAGGEEDASTSDVVTFDSTAADAARPVDSGSIDAGEDAGDLDASDLDVDASCPFGMVNCGGGCMPVDVDNCGACGYGCFSGQTCASLDAGADAGAQPFACQGQEPFAPHQVAPLSGTMAAIRRPTFSIAPVAPSASLPHIQVCADAACAHPLLDTQTTQAASPASDLPSGAVFWRAFYSAGTHVVSSPTWMLDVPQIGAPHDSTPKLAHDLDGDGLGDVVLYTTQDTSSTGAFYVFFGRSGGPSETWSTKLDAFGALGDGGTGFIPTLTVGNFDGDYDRDGFGDLGAGLLGPSGDLDWGTVFFGSVSGPHGATDGRYSGPVGYSSTVGRSCGDIDGDGFANLLLVNALQNKLTSIDGNASRSPSAFGPEFSVSFPGAVSFGTPSAALGDVNGDGYGDFAVAISPSSSGGRVFVLLGSAAGMQTATYTTLVGGGVGSDNFGRAIDSGDIDGDGLSDIVVGAPGENKVYVFRGAPGGISVTPKWTINGGALTDAGVVSNFGASVAVADYNGDGYADVALVSSLGGASKIVVYPGGAAGPAATFSTVLTPLTPTDTFASIASPGDATGDGYPDLVAASGSNSGNFFHGSATGVFRNSSDQYMPLPFQATSTAN